MKNNYLRSIARCLSPSCLSNVGIRALRESTVTLSLILLAALLVSCSASSSRIFGGTGSGVTVIGVVAKTGLGVAFNKNRRASDFAVTLSERGKLPVLRASSLRQIIGSQRHNDMLRRYADRGRLAQQDIQVLMAAGLPTKHAIIVRVEDDRIAKLPMTREPVTNDSGALLVDRERRVLATQRVTTLSAMIINLQNGSVRWDQSFQVDPIATAYSTEYLGSSFSASLAAAFANTMVNGVRRGRYPDPPPVELSLEVLLEEVAKSQPIR